MKRHIDRPVAAAADELQQLQEGEREGGALQGNMSRQMTACATSQGKRRASVNSSNENDLGRTSVNCIHVQL